VDLAVAGKGKRVIETTRRVIAGLLRLVDENKIVSLEGEERESTCENHLKGAHGNQKKRNTKGHP